MRMKLLFPVLAGALFFAVSCATTPPPEKPTPQPTTTTPPEKPAVPAPEKELAQAKSLQQKVDGYGLGQYDPDDYATATQSLKAGEDAYGKDNAASKQSLDASITAFNAVITKGGPKLVAVLEDQSISAKKSADDLKASVAVKDDYEKADAVYQGALKEKDAGDMEAAGNDFAKSRDMFTAVAKTAQQKKDAATKSLQDAEQAMSTAKQTAADAEKSMQDQGAPQ